VGGRDFSNAALLEIVGEELDFEDPVFFFLEIGMKPLLVIDVGEKLVDERRLGGAVGALAVLLIDSVS